MALLANNVSCTRESYLDGIIDRFETLRGSCERNGAYQVKGKTPQGGQIELSGESDVNLCIVRQCDSLASLEQKSPAVWYWLEHPRPREYGLKPRESPETMPSTPNDRSGMVTWEIVVLIMTEDRDPVVWR